MASKKPQWWLVNTSRRAIPLRLSRSREVYDSVLDGVIAPVELVVRGREAVALHLLIHRLRQVVERPHAFVSMSGSRGEHKGCSHKEVFLFSVIVDLVCCWYLLIYMFRDII